MGFLGGAIGLLTGVQQVEQALGGGGGAANEIPITSLCPATPPDKVDAVTRAMTARPSEIAAARSVIEAWARGGGKARDRDMAKVRSTWDTTAGMARALVWLAWGGGDCVVGSGDIPLQTEANRIASLDPGIVAVQDGQPLGDARIPRPPISLTSATVGIVVAGVLLLVAFALARRARG